MTQINGIMPTPGTGTAAAPRGAVSGRDGVEDDTTGYAPNAQWLTVSGAVRPDLLHDGKNRGIRIACSGKLSPAALTCGRASVAPWQTRRHQHAKLRLTALFSITTDGIIYRHASLFEQVSAARLTRNSNRFCAGGAPAPLIVACIRAVAHRRFGAPPIEDEAGRNTTARQAGAVITDADGHVR